MGISSKLKFNFFSFERNMRKIIIVKVGFVKNICNKQHDKYKFNHHPTCIMLTEGFGWQSNRLSPFSPRFKVC